MNSLRTTVAVFSPTHPLVDSLKTALIPTRTRRLMNPLKTTVTVVSLLVLAAIAAPADAQGVPEAEMREGVTYYQQTYIKFLPGKAEEGKAIIEDHLAPATRAAGTDFVFFEPMTGEWDMIVFFEMEDGVGEMAWEVSPAESRYRAALVEAVGGMDEARALIGRYGATLAEGRSDLVFRPTAD